MPQVLWLSVSNDLRMDAKRDLADVDAQKIPVHPPVSDQPFLVHTHVRGSELTTTVLSWSASRGAYGDCRVL